MPLLAIDDADEAVPIAEPLVTGRLKMREVTPRTLAVLSAGCGMLCVSGAIVGAGTVLDPRGGPLDLTAIITYARETTGIADT